MEELAPTEFSEDIKALDVPSAEPMDAGLFVTFALPVPRLLSVTHLLELRITPIQNAEYEWFGFLKRMTRLKRTTTASRLANRFRFANS